MNLLGKPCFTCRFNTDRPETVMGNHGNLLVPPVSADFQTRILRGIITDPSRLDKLRNAKPLYGENAGGKFAESIRPFVMRNDSPHRLSHERLGFGRDDSHFDRAF
jgi:UDP-N-acetylglucosamine 2-epimerase